MENKSLAQALYKTVDIEKRYPGFIRPWQDSGLRLQCGGRSRYRHKKFVMERAVHYQLPSYGH